MAFAALATVRLKATSGLPEDDVVNTFNFAGEDTLDETEAGVIAGYVANFYNLNAVGQSATIGSYLSPSLSRTTGACTVTIARYVFTTTPYTLETPLTELGFTLPDISSGATGFPDEVALCLSYRQTLAGSTAAPERSRGRLYVGPLNSSAATASSGQPNVPATAFVSNLLLAGGRLVQLGASQDANMVADWCVYSRADQAFRVITDGWVDNAWDTQRRRGRDATSRTFEDWTA